MKVLTRQQARWSEYLSQFNLAIRFCPGKLRTKPDASVAATLAGVFAILVNKFCKIMEIFYKFYLPR